MIEKIQLKVQVPEKYTGMRLDACLAKLLPSYSRGVLASWIESGQVLVNNETSRKKNKLAGGEQITVDAEIEQACHWQPQDIPLNVVYDDEDIIVINKPAGLVVHPGAGVSSNTLANGLLYAYPELNQLPRSGIVHRLDKDTSGLMVVARTLTAHANLVEKLQRHDVAREYIAIVNGTPIVGGRVDYQISRHPKARTKMAVVEHGGKRAVSHFKIIEKFKSHTYISVVLETGRTHQIRVHMAHLGYPLLGDKVYGGRPVIPKGCSDNLKDAIQQFPRQALHAKKLAFKHPITDKLVTFEVEIPDDIEKLLKLFSA